MLVQTEAQVSRRDRGFFVGMAIAAMTTVFFGFAPSYYLKSFTHITQYPTGVPRAAECVYRFRWSITREALFAGPAIGTDDDQPRVGIARRDDGEGLGERVLTLERFDAADADDRRTAALGGQGGERLGDVSVAFDSLWLGHGYSIIPYITCQDVFGRFFRLSLHYRL